MHFKIQGRVLEVQARICREFPTLRVIAVQSAEGKVLASVETQAAGAYKLDYEWPTAHDVLLSVTLALDAPIENVAAARTVSGRNIFISEAMVMANEWKVDPKNKEALSVTKNILVECCCLVWALRGYYTVLGKVVDADSLVPLGGATVEAQDWDPSGAHDFLGSDVTDGLGRFAIHARVSDFVSEDTGTGWRPDLRFRVSRVDPSGFKQVCLDFEDDKIRLNWPNCEPVEIAVDCCMAIIENVGGWDAHLAPGPRGIDPEGYAHGANTEGKYGGTAGSPEVHNAPFGGTVDLCGKDPCKKVDKYQYSVAKWSDTTPPAEADYAALRPNWSEDVTKGYTVIFIPGYGFMWVPIKDSKNQVADGDGFFDILFNADDPGHKLFMPWNTRTFDNGKYSVRLALKDSATGAIFKSHPVQVRIDNCAPRAELSLDVVKPCDDIVVGDIVTGKFTARDKDATDDPKCVKAHHHEYKLAFEGDSVGGTISEQHETNPALNGVTNATFSWNTAGLVPCGYRIYLWVWDRSIIDGIPSGPWHGNFNFDQIYFCLRTKPTEPT